VPLSDVAQVATLPGPYDGLFLSNYATLRLRDELSRVKGVGDVMVRGVGSYSMRVWLDPDRLAARQLTTQDVIAALSSAERPGRRRSGRPAAQPAGAAVPVHRHDPRPAHRPGAVRGIVVKSGGEGQPVYLRDVAESNWAPRVRLVQLPQRVRRRTS
jgi:hydrophobic/amphiphilic exporter-1 (mainly G- bacteria), HAE1 family